MTEDPREKATNTRLWDLAARLVKEESFGPALVVAPYTEVEQAVARMQANPYRLATSIFTADATLFASLAARLDYGLVNRNRPTAGARSDLPFGGCGLSDRPPYACGCSGGRTRYSALSIA